MLTMQNMLRIATAKWYLSAKKIIFIIKDIARPSLSQVNASASNKFNRTS